MNLVQICVVIVGLMVFEVVSSVDNAVINAEVLATTPAAARRWFLSWGLLFSVVIVRGLLPLLIVWIGAPQLGIHGAISAAFSTSLVVQAALHHSQPILLAGGGIYLALLFLHWLLATKKAYAFPLEQLLHRSSQAWFYVAAGVSIGSALLLAWQVEPRVIVSLVVGAAAFFLTSNLKTSAEAAEAKLTHRRTSPWRKLLYLELIDTAFSIDGVLGAFAFTISVPLILIGNGLGVLVVRQLTIRGMQHIGNYRYLTNGAMYSIGALGAVMLLDGFGIALPFWVSPLLTLSIVGYFFWRSHLALSSLGA